MPAADGRDMLCFAMKKSLLFGALCACTFGFICAPIHAQDAPPAPAQTADAKSGYDLFLEARALVKDGPNGEPLARETLAPDENLRRQRLGTARNAPALAKLREALKAYIVFREPDFSNPEKALTELDNTAAVRNFARYLSQEAAVRAADGDAASASQSSLDALELSTQIARGPIINALVGAATTAIARKSLLQNASGLNAAQAREVADKWQKTSDYFPTYAQTLRDEEQTQMSFLSQSFAADIAQWNDPIARAKAEAELKKARDKGELTPEKVQEDQELMGQLQGLTFADVVADTRAVFDAALLRANQPYFVAKTEAPLRAADPLTAQTAELISSAATRFYAERDVVNNRELAAALRLRAAKLESGQYPATFDAGADPFSPTLAPLIYQHAGNSYVLYSVGPDGKDDNGAEIQTLITDVETGAKTVSARLMPNSTGDILAPVL